jgi:hypothetical protein
MLPSSEFDWQRVECGLLFPLIWGNGLGALPAFHLTIEARGRLFGLEMEMKRINLGCLA